MQQLDDEAKDLQAQVPRPDLLLGVMSSMQNCGSLEMSPL